MKSEMCSALAPRSRGVGSVEPPPHYYLGATELSQLEVWGVSELLFRANSGSVQFISEHSGLSAA